MIRDDVICLSIRFPASQITIIVTALDIRYFDFSYFCQRNKLTLTISYSNKALITFHHQYSNMAE